MKYKVSFFAFLFIFSGALIARIMKSLKPKQVTKTLITLSNSMRSSLHPIDSELHLELQALITISNRLIM